MAHHMDNFLRQLESLESLRNPTVPVKEKIHNLKLELKFLKTFFYFTEQLYLKHGYLKFSSERVRDVVANAAADIQQASENSLGQRAVYHLVSDASSKISVAKRNARAVYRVVLRLPRPNALISDEPTLKSFDSVIQNLKDLMKSKAGCNVLLKRQIEALGEKLRFLKIFLWFRDNCSMENGQLKHLLTRIKTVSDTAACLSYMCWVDKMDDKVMDNLNRELTKLLDMIDPLTGATGDIGIIYWKASTSVRSQIPLLAHSLEIFVDFLLENLTATIKNQRKILYEGLIYLINFLMDPPQEFSKDEELRLTHAKAVAKESGHLIYSFHVKEITDHMFRDRESVLSKLIEKIKLIKAEVSLMKLLRHKPDLLKIGNLLEGLKFLRKSLMDPTEEIIEDELADVEEMTKEAETLISQFNVDRMTRDEVVETNIPLLILLQKIKLVKVQLRLMQVSNQKHSMKDQLKSLHAALTFLRTFLKDPPSEYAEDWKRILTQIEAVVSEVEAFIDKSSVNELTENMIRELNLAHFELLEKIKLVKAEAYLMQQVGHKNRLKKDEIETLHLGLRILRTFQMSQQQECKKDSANILAQTEAVFSEAATLVCSHLENKKVDLEMETNHLLQKIKVITGEIRKVYDHLWLSSWSNCPRTDGLGFVDSFVRNLEELLTYNADSISTLKYQIEIIHQDFKCVRKYLDDCSGLHYEQDEENNHPEIVIQLSYEAEHVINSFLVQGYPVWLHLLQFFDIIEKVKSIRRKVEELITQKRCDGARVRNVSLQVDNAPSDEKVLHPGEEAKNKGKSIVVGFNDEAGKIIEKLIHGSKQLGIVSIVGMAGQGKTTLAKKVYDDENVRSYFHARAWCYVSERYQKNKMLLNILQKMSVNENYEKSGEDLAQELDHTDSDNGDDEKSEEDLALDLRQRLLHRKYLIVMDDVWNIEAWNLLQECLPENQHNGSRILFTSRHANLLKEDDSNCYTHQLRLLKDDESWDLLQSEVFDGGVSPKELESVGSRIAESCEGLPLAVTLMAGFLRTKAQTEDCWKEVARSLTSTFADQTIFEQYDRILEHSYKDLSNYLKPCFLYLGTFLEGSEIPVYKLIWLWIAEGFVGKSNLGSSEHVAEVYLMDLIRRNLVKSTGERSKGGVKACNVHDILREFCRVKAKEENFFQLIPESTESSATSNGLDFPYRLCIDSKQEDFIALQNKPSDPRLRSLIFSAARQVHSISRDEVSFIKLSYKLLRVLDLGSFTIRGFPIGIEDLVLLRYLAIWMDSSHIPHSIVKLRDLETFLLRQSRGEVELPDSFWFMASLRHVRIRNRASLGQGNNYIHVFSNREKDNEKASSENTKLDNLLSFSTPCLCYGEHMEKRMKKLPNLLKLRCTFMDSWDPVTNCILFPELSFLLKLESLKVSYHGSVKDLSSKLIPSNLEKIFPSNLRKLTLSHFRMPWKNISVIGKLENLEVLKLLFKAFDGQQWKIKEGEFPKLRFLKLESLNIVEWTASEDYVSNLEQLVLKDCKQLQKIPSCLETAENLKMIEVQGCTSAVSQSVEEIAQAQLEDNNEIKLSINHPVRS